MNEAPKAKGARELVAEMVGSGHVRDDPLD
jgi:hypothetical protein